MSTTTYTEALARALAYTDEVGLSDGTDRPTHDLDTALEGAPTMSVDPATVPTNNGPMRPGEPQLARLVEDRWDEAYQQWELGRMSSPSTYDLVHYACLVCCVHPDTFDFDRVADDLFDLMSEGYHDQLDLARWVVIQLRAGSIR